MSLLTMALAVCCIVHTCGDHGIVTDLFYELFLAFCFMDLGEIDMNNDSHLDQLSIQALRIFVSIAYVDQYLIHPVLTDISSCVFYGCYNGNPIDLFTVLS